jgi:hypothetical protein
MLELNHTYFSICVSDNDLDFTSEITLHDDGITIKTPGYYKGKPHFVKYEAITEVAVKEDSISLKVARTTLTLSGFDKSLLSDIQQVISVGKTESVSGSKLYRKWQRQEKAAEKKERIDAITEQRKAETKAYKAKRRAEHIDRALSLAEDVFSDKAADVANAKIQSSIENLIILPGDTEPVMAEKIQKLFKAYNRAIHNDDVDEEVAENILSDLDHSIQTLQNAYPTSKYCTMFTDRLSKILDEQKAKNKKETRLTIVGGIIFAVAAIIYYYKDIVNFFK